MSVFDNFYTLNLNLEYLDTFSNHSIIFANGLNQVAIVVGVTLFNKNGKPIALDEKEIKEIENSIYFANPITGEELKNNKQLNFSNKSGEFVTASPATGYNENVFYKIHNNQMHFIRYVSSSTPFLSTHFCVGISTPKGKKYDTSNNGTGRLLPSGSPYFSPKFLNITTNQAINYSLMSNIEISKQIDKIESFHIIDNNVDVSLQITNPKDFENPNIYNIKGISSYSSFIIKLKNGNPIKKKRIYSNPPIPNMLLKITNVRCNDSSKEEEDLLKADMVLAFKKIENQAYHLSLVFIDSKRCGIEDDSHIMIWDKFKKEPFISYNIRENSGNKHIIESENLKQSVPPYSEDYITVIMANHTIPSKEFIETDSSITLTGMREGEPIENKESFSSLEIYDYFGNKGIIKLKLAKNTWPKISINE